MTSKPKDTDKQTAEIPNVDNAATTAGVQATAIISATATKDDNPAALDKVAASLGSCPAMIAPRGSSRLPIASRLLCSILQLPAYADIYKGEGNEDLRDGAVTLSLIMADKLISAGVQLE